MNYLDENSRKLFLTFLRIVGIYATVWWCTEHLKTFLEIIVNFFYLKHEQTLTLKEEYGPWAVITGATDGIGKQYAIELAKRGMNICLISRSETKLIVVANEIEQNLNVATKFIVADFSRGRSIYEHIRNQLKGLDIGILINNVGIMHDIPENFDKISEDTLWDMINVNIGAVTLMSSIVIPDMKTRKRGLILNVSSGATSQPMPMAALYSATKCYTRNLSIALEKELSKYNIKVQMIIPLFVRTKMTHFIKIPKAGQIFVPTAETYVKSAIKTLGKHSQTCGYWSHSIQFILLNTIPEFIRIHFAHIINKKFRKEYHDRQKLMKNN